LDFDKLDISQDMINHLISLDYKNMTHVQEKAIPHILQNQDIIVQAKTSSGKTLCFSIPIIEKLNTTKFIIQALIISPTRELSDQVASYIRKIAKFKQNIKILTLCGGLSFASQEKSLLHKAHIIVATPGRLIQHINKKNIDLKKISTLVLDEADRMLDMGFYDDILNIISYIPKNRNTLLFSATYTNDIENLTQNIMNNPIKIDIDIKKEENIIDEYFYKIDSNDKVFDKLTLINRVISKFKAKSLIIFCNTKIQCDELYDKFYDLKIDSLVLHSNLDQNIRNETLILFANKSYPILICTDVASRGLDINRVDLVINYDFPNELEVYTHRIGRCGRSGVKGVAISLIDSKYIYKIDLLKEYLKKDIIFEDINRLKNIKEYKITHLYRTLFINGGKKKKLRAGDILGALTVALKLDKNDIGKIDILDHCSYVAIKKEVFDIAIQGLQKSKIKGKYFKIFEK